jgi:hypothetical protein
MTTEPPRHGEKTEDFATDAARILADEVMGGDAVPSRATLSGAMFAGDLDEPRASGRAARQQADGEPGTTTALVRSALRAIVPRSTFRFTRSQVRSFTFAVRREKLAPVAASLSRCLFVSTGHSDFCM